ncbi:MAG TPA: hypothetical protein VLS27_09330, partial [Gammaproteobacteria bacterium]|nr:hypothetical protein [Gammaproteobacteria bacterium]
MSVPELVSGTESGIDATNAVFAHPFVEERFTRASAEGFREAFLLIDGIRCGACALNVERTLQKL